MIIGDRLPWRVVLRLHAPWLVLTAAVAGTAWVVKWQLGAAFPFSPMPFQIAGVALAIFLGFRNNSAYDRWWEGRKLWGGIVNHSRALGRQVTTMVVAPPDDHGAVEAFRQQVLYRHVAWLHALKQQLRAQPVLAELVPFVSQEEHATLQGQQNIAAWLVHRNGVALAEAARRGWLTDIRWDSIDRTLTALIELQGGCERIKSTPIPTAYRVFTHRFTRVYIAALPLGLVENVSLSTLPLLLGLSLAFLVLETLGRLMEDPFTLAANGLALNAICRTIEINLRQQLGEDPRGLPGPVTPESFSGIPVLL